MIWATRPEEALKAKGINTIKQLRQTPPQVLQSIFGDQTPHMLRLAQGIDNREVEPDREAKSISSEETFAEDIIDKDILLSVLLTQVEDVAQRLSDCLFSQVFFTRFGCQYWLFLSMLFIIHSNFLMAATKATILHFPPFSINLW